MGWFMSNEIVVALIALLGTALGTFGGIITANKLTNYRIEQLEIKVDKHNSVIERVFNLEKSNDLIIDRLKTVNHRIDEIKEEIGG